MVVLQEPATDAQALSVLALVVVVPAAMLAGRWLLQRRLRALMALPAAPRAPDAPDGTDDGVEAPAAPAFVRLDADTPRPGAVEVREAGVRAARARLRSAFLLELAAAFVAMAVAVAVLGDAALLFLAFNGPLYLVFLVARHHVRRRQFRALDLRPTWVRWLEGGVAVGVALLTLGRIRLRDDLQAKADRQGHLNPFWQAAHVLVLPAVVALVGAVAWLLGNAGGAALLAVAGVHVGGLLLLRRRAATAPGRSLLVLRVFDLDANAHFTFGGLLAFWHHVGPFYTVVDASLWRFGSRIDSWRYALGMVALAALGLTASVVASEAAVVPAAAVPWAGGAAVLAAVAVYVAVARRRMAARFVRSVDGLRRRLDGVERHPLTPALTYRAVPARCHDDTWRGTVAEFAGRSSMVLMDLRGFSDARKGCAWEVDFLLDTVAVDRILFLTDGGTDPEPVERLIRSCWARQRAGSPNLVPGAPPVRIYQAGAEDEADVQALLDLLVEGASRSPR